MRAWTLLSVCVVLAACGSDDDDPLADQKGASSSSSSGGEDQSSSSSSTSGSPPDGTFSSSSGAPFSCDPDAIRYDVDNCGACGTRCEDTEICHGAACVASTGDGTSCASPLVLPADDNEMGFRLPTLGAATHVSSCGPEAPAPTRYFRLTGREGHTLNSIEVRGGGPELRVAIVAYQTSTCDDSVELACSDQRDPAASKWPRLEPGTASGETLWFAVTLEGTPTEPLYLRLDD